MEGRGTSVLATLTHSLQLIIPKLCLRTTRPLPTAGGSTFRKISRLPDRGDTKRLNRIFQDFPDGESFRARPAAQQADARPFRAFLI